MHNFFGSPNKVEFDPKEKSENGLKFNCVTSSTICCKVCDPDYLRNDVHAEVTATNWNYGEYVSCAWFKNFMPLDGRNVIWCENLCSVNRFNEKTSIPVCGNYNLSRDGIFWFKKWPAISRKFIPYFEQNVDISNLNLHVDHDSDLISLHLVKCGFSGIWDTIVWIFGGICSFYSFSCS